METVYVHPTKCIILFTQTKPVVVAQQLVSNQLEKVPLKIGECLKQLQTRIMWHMF